MKTQLLILILFPILLFSCMEKQEKIQWISTTESEPWVQQKEIFIKELKEQKFDVQVFPEQTLQDIEGFGACFNELGWSSLSLLSDSDRDQVMDELFTPGKGLNFTVSRMPIGANDFSLDWYSYDEIDQDFSLEHFSIENDEKKLIPFIKKAQQYNPALKIWASPWCPPSWMKYNKHYACRPDVVNDLEGDPTTDLEGTDMFIQEDRYMETYARYFGKFIDAYKGKGIDIYCVAPQNEFNSCQNFPSCTWTAQSLAKFTGRFLGPEMEKRNVTIMLGTVERANTALCDTILNDPDCKKYITSVGFQWAGKGAISDIYERYPHLKMYQTEQECGDGKNDWKGAVYAWKLMEHYLSNGCSIYDYWNISLEKGGISHWGWAQNSLVVVDPATKSFEYSHEFYVMKHFSHFIQPGAKRIQTSDYNNLLAFKNPDGSIIIVAGNFGIEDKTISISIQHKIIQMTLKANSFNTFKM